MPKTIAMNTAKQAFLKEEFIPLLRRLQPGQKGKWGKMDAQQMVEHFRQALKVANGKINAPLHSNDMERLQKIRQFLMIDVPFKENTRSPLLGEEPLPHKFSSLQEAIDKLEVELQDVFSVYENNEGKIILNPVFGELDYEQQVQLLHKHATHHLVQFGLL